MAQQWMLWIQLVAKKKKVIIKDFTSSWGRESMTRSSSSCPELSPSWAEAAGWPACQLGTSTVALGATGPKLGPRSVEWVSGRDWVCEGLPTRLPVHFLASLDLEPHHRSPQTSSSCYTFCTSLSAKVSMVEEDGRVEGCALIFSFENFKITTRCWTIVDRRMLDPTKKKKKRYLMSRGKREAPARQ